MSRPRRCTLITGQKFTGKTTLLLQMLEDYPGKINIYDRRREKNYRHIAPIATSDIKLQKTGRYKVHGMEWKEIIDQYHQYWTDGMVVLDDAANYLPHSEYKPLTEMMGGCRHIPMDMIIATHSINRTPAYVLSLADVIILFKTNESLESYVKDSVPKSDLLTTAHSQIEASSNRHEHQTLQMQDIED